MITRIITVFRQPGNEPEGTGTFADGVFPLTLADQMAFDKDHSMRRSYETDYRVARKQADASPVFA